MWRWQIHLITKIYKTNDIVNCNAVRLYWTNPCIKNDLKRRMIEYSKWLDLVFLYVYAIHIFTRKSILLTPNFLFQAAWVFLNDEGIKSNLTIFRKRFYCANYTKDSEREVVHDDNKTPFMSTGQTKKKAFHFTNLEWLCQNDIIKMVYTLLS